MKNRRFIEHETHVDIEEFINGVWAVTQCNVVLSSKSKEKNYKRYKISKKERSALKTKHNGMCAICGREKKLVIDHNHATGKVRGLLCISCNVGIGLLQDSTEVLDKAIKYLSEN